MKGRNILAALLAACLLLAGCVENHGESSAPEPPASNPSGGPEAGTQPDMAVTRTINSGALAPEDIAGHMFYEWFAPYLTAETPEAQRATNYLISSVRIYGTVEEFAAVIRYYVKGPISSPGITELYRSVNEATAYVQTEMRILRTGDGEYGMMGEPGSAPPATEGLAPVPLPPLNAFSLSVEYRPDAGTLSFTVPEDAGDDFQVLTSGRLHMGNGSFMSWHAFEEESAAKAWIPGKTYTTEVSREVIDSLSLSAYDGEGEVTVQIDRDGFVNRLDPYYLQVLAAKSEILPVVKERVDSYRNGTPPDIPNHHAPWPEDFPPIADSLPEITGPNSFTIRQLGGDQMLSVYLAVPIDGEKEMQMTIYQYDDGSGKVSWGSGDTFFVPNAGDLLWEVQDLDLYATAPEPDPGIPPERPGPVPADGVTATAVQASYPLGAEKVEITLQNNSDQHMHTGMYYHVERLTGGAWEKIPLEFGIEDVGLELPAGESTTKAFWIYPDQYDYTAGAYRIVWAYHDGDTGFPAEFTLE